MWNESEGYKYNVSIANIVLAQQWISELDVNALHTMGLTTVTEDGNCMISTIWRFLSSLEFDVASAS